MSRSNVVVCDTGSGLVKVGFAGDVSPVASVPCMLGRKSNGQGASQIVVGHDCQRSDQQLEVSCPMQNGCVDNWEDLKLIWDQAFSRELHINARDSKILLSDMALNTSSHRHTVLETMFEHFGFAAANIQLQAVLALYSQGHLSGLVVDSGENLSSMVAVLDGMVFPHASCHVNVAGRRITTHLLDLLRCKGHVLSVSCHRDMEGLRVAKEKMCYTAVNLQREMKLARETTCISKSYTLPDGRKICMGPERFLAPEALFNPSLVDEEGPGIAETAFNCINGMPIDERRNLYEHVIVSGGSTMFPGFPTRLQSELEDLYSKHILKGDDKLSSSKARIRVSDPPNRKYSAFWGGAVLGEIMQDQPDFWISREDYEEDPYRAIKKCGLS